MVYLYMPPHHTRATPSPTPLAATRPPRRQLIMVELKKRLGSLMRKHSAPASTTADTPEAAAARGVKLFCESGAANSGEEVLHLPAIVEAAVASPAAAATAARQMRVFLSKDNYNRPHVQYNAVMLIRILADNPGASFTKNLDKPFADTVKHLLRNGHDPSVSQLIHETLDSLERDKATDANLNLLFAMWRKEKGLMETAAKSFGPRTMNAPVWPAARPVHGGVGAGTGRATGLPPPQELAARIQEARSSAQLLLQLVQSTPAHELLGNELVKEFAERCTTAQRSVHGYIACDSPAPDDDTMLTLIETNEQLSLAASKHQRAILQARRLMGASPSPPVQNGTSHATAAPPPQPSPQAPTQPGHTMTKDSATQNTLSSSTLSPSLSTASGQQRSGTTEENPFADHNATSYTPPPGPPPRQGLRADGRGGFPDAGDSGYSHGAPNTITKEDEPYPAPQRPRTPVLQIPQPSQSQPQPQAPDVSPITERNPITYRY